jgi:hypothetical protein
MNIRLSEKHGINPAVGICFFCMKDKDVILFGKMSAAKKAKMFPEEKNYDWQDPQDAEAPRRVCISKEPCSECEKWMEQGVILISVDAKLSSSKEDPYRTGGWCVLKDEAIERMFPPETAEDILKKRVCFIEDEGWEMLGLPREELQQ